MENFPATYFTFSTRYPDRPRVELGGSYEYTPQPSNPMKRTLMLNLQGMCYFTNANGTLNLTVEPGRNMGLLDDFYARHEIWKRFQILHPAYGLRVVKFATPLEVPEGLKGANGLLPDFQVSLLEQP